MGLRMEQIFSVTFTHQLTLGDLQEFIQTVVESGFPPDSKIRVNHYKGALRDPSTTTLTVRKSP